MFYTKGSVENLFWIVVNALKENYRKLFSVCIMQKKKIKINLTNDVKIFMLVNDKIVSTKAENYIE